MPVLHERIIARRRDHTTYPSTALTPIARLCRDKGRRLVTQGDLSVARGVEQNVVPTAQGTGGEVGGQRRVVVVHDHDLIGGGRHEAAHVVHVQRRVGDRGRTVRCVDLTKAGQARHVDIDRGPVQGEVVARTVHIELSGFGQVDRTAQCKVAVETAHAGGNVQVTGIREGRVEVGVDRQRIDHAASSIRDCLGKRTGTAIDYSTAGIGQRMTVVGAEEVVGAVIGKRVVQARLFHWKTRVEGAVIGHPTEVHAVIEVITCRGDRTIVHKCDIMVDTATGLESRRRSRIGSQRDSGVGIGDVPHAKLGPCARYSGIGREQRTAKDHPTGAGQRAAV